MFLKTPEDPRPHHSGPKIKILSASLEKDPVIKPLRDLDSETLQATIPHIPLWVKSPDYERRQGDKESETQLLGTIWTTRLTQL
ncbi:synaptotagmin-2 isoform X2 [Zea mays]|uniref:synaptotagmin-2 isoform X2 n=1 Tax=Zea mays TaxID=4577 RepID=UPI0004DEAA25|nr:synaptotagmin-2 isoform X2 [Zea mays]|eukprot:XP_023155885.1 synaptotagmin-2 isoform X2 [Zea mays]